MRRGRKPGLFFIQKEEDEWSVVPMGKLTAGGAVAKA